MALQGSNLPPSEEGSEFRYMVPKYKANAVVTITIMNQGKSRAGSDLIYHDGFVHFGTFDRQNEQDNGNVRHVTSCVLCFKSGDDIAADKLFTALNLLSSPYVVTPFAYGRGVGDFNGHSFLAVPQFSSTLVPYLRAQSKVTIDKQRFTEEFIGIIRNVVSGILTLHAEGFCCRYLKAQHILVFTVGASKTGQLWNFCRTESEDVKLQDWTRLGTIIEAAAKAQLISTIEINDLCMRLKNGSLKGLQILKQSALLTVQEKFENILALNFYIEVHKKDQFRSASADQQALNNLRSFIAAKHDWVLKIPPWILNIPGYKSNHPTTGGGFALWLRDRVEHAFSCVPIKISRPPISLIQILGIDPDLECVLRQTWPELYMEVQKLVEQLGIHY